MNKSYAQILGWVLGLMLTTSAICDARDKWEITLGETVGTTALKKIDPLPSNSNWEYGNKSLVAGNLGSFKVGLGIEWFE